MMFNLKDISGVEVPSGDLHPYFDGERWQHIIQIIHPVLKRHGIGACICATKVVKESENNTDGLGGVLPVVLIQPVASSSCKDEPLLKSEIEEKLRHQGFDRPIGIYVDHEMSFLNKSAQEKALADPISPSGGSKDHYKTESPSKARDTSGSDTGESNDIGGTELPLRTGGNVADETYGLHDVHGSELSPNKYVAASVKNRGGNTQKLIPIIPPALHDLLKQAQASPLENSKLKFQVPQTMV